MSHLQEFEFSTSHKHTNTIRIECTFIQSPLKLHIRHHLLHFTCSFFLPSVFLFFFLFFFFHKFYSYLLFRSLVIHHNNTQLSRSPAIRLYMSNMKNSFPSAVSHQIALLLFFASIERLVVYISDTLSLTNGGSIRAYGVHVNFVCQSIRSFVCICGVNVMHCTNTYACNGFI